MPPVTDDTMVFAVAPEGTGDGIPMVLLGIPAAAWGYMKDGKTHTFDLTKAGVRVKLILYGAADHTEAMKCIEGYLLPRGVAIEDRRREDFGIPEPKP